MKSDLKARHAALTMLGDIIDRKQPLEAALDALRGEALEPRDRAFAQALAMMVLRRCGEIDAILGQFMQKPFPPKLVAMQQLMRIGVAQLLWLDTPPHAAIDTSVNLAKMLRQPKLAGVVNAVLRRISEQKDALAPRCDGRLNTPVWLWQSWVRDYGEEKAAAIAVAHCEEPPLDITVVADPIGWAQPLEGEVISGQTVRRETGDVSLLPGYADGEWWVQDVAATLPARLLGDVKGKTVLDLCAAPGGKTAQLAKAGARVIALDRSPERMVRLQENMRRLKLDVETVIADLLHWRPEAAVDAILLDAPCTATGTIRRHPDILHHRHKSDVADMASLQQAMLGRVADWLKPGGVLVYCVCSLQAREGEAQVAGILKSQPALTLDSITSAADGIPAEWITPQGMLRTLPFYLPGGMDGFFAARMVKK